LGLSNKRRASLGSALGFAVGCLNHTLLAVLGIPALILCTLAAGAGWMGTWLTRHPRAYSLLQAPQATLHRIIRRTLTSLKTASNHHAKIRAGRGSATTPPEEARP
jgi:threonine/homoserine/homoserine lactone efflux protein